MYIAVQNELVAAYNFLRDREYRRLYPNRQAGFTEMKKAIDEGDVTGAKADKIQEELESVQNLIPLKLSEAEPKKSGT